MPNGCVRKARDRGSHASYSDDVQNKVWYDIKTMNVIHTAQSVRVVERVDKKWNEERQLNQGNAK